MALSRYEIERWSKIRRKYGLEKEEWMQMFTDQGGACKLCGTHQAELRKKLCVEHCHETGRVRGLLCDTCNRAIGLLKDDPELLRKAAKYLEEN